jgi:hypothetical protein
MTFDEQVAALRGKVVPSQSQKNKADCTPEEWAGHLDYAKAWRQANPDKARAAVAAWRKANPEKDRVWKAANPEKCRASVAAWRKANRERDRATTKAWRKANPDKKRAAEKAWRQANKEMCRAAKKARYKANPDKIRASAAAWGKANPDKKRAANKAWAKANPDKTRAAKQAWNKANPNYSKERYKNDPVYRMMCNLRNRQNTFFKNKIRSLSMVRDMGCTQEFFRQHIESQFTADMTMENHGTVWHLDHIYPLSKADIVDNTVHFLAAANWRNLQPMLGPENLEKSDTITPEAQALFDELKAEFSSYDEAHGAEVVPF